MKYTFCMVTEKNNLIKPPINPTIKKATFLAATVAVIVLVVGYLYTVDANKAVRKIERIAQLGSIGKPVYCQKENPRIILSHLVTAFGGPIEPVYYPGTATCFYFVDNLNAAKANTLVSKVQSDGYSVSRVDGYGSYAANTINEAWEREYPLIGEYSRVSDAKVVDLLLRKDEKAHYQGTRIYFNKNTFSIGDYYEYHNAVPRHTEAEAKKLTNIKIKYEHYPSGLLEP